ncbi:hypothetical protein [Ancylobacter terrae]|uniref:hypothetical protein n=1 Tax=Ancylobacter sp. sgz301288 TaxID=3342077 RepID=UPI00385BC725
MAALLNLPNGHVSLEFRASDMASIGKLLRKLHGKPSIVQHPTFSEYQFVGFSLIFQNEWDDPCLISSSNEGDQALHMLRDLLSAA